MDEDLVSERMSILIIDLLEIIQINKDHGSQLSRLLLLQFFFRIFLDSLPVHHSCQVISGHFSLQIFHLFFLFLYIDQESHRGSGRSLLAILKIQPEKIPLNRAFFIYKGDLVLIDDPFFHGFFHAF